MLLLFLFSQALCDIEEDIYHTIAEEWQSRPVTWVMEGFSFVSSPVLDIVPPSVLYLSKKENVAKHGVIGFVGDCATVIPLKLIIERERPQGDGTGWHSSFPSGHTAFSFTQAVIYSHHYPKMKVPLFIYAAIVGFSRIYLGKHYPTDVLGGAVLGISIGVLTIKLCK
jgi:undecaprenyl-diphosphatase